MNASKTLGRGGIAAGVFLSLCGVSLAEVVDRSKPEARPVAPIPEEQAAVDLTNPHQPIPGGLQPRGGVPQRVEADIDVNTTADDFVALVLDSDGADNLYIKVQQQDAGNKFDHIGFYHGVSGGGWPGMTGGAAFFTIPTADQFNSAHMIVLHDGNGNVTLRFESMDGGGRITEYTRGGWAPRNGAGAGMGGWNGLFVIDNWGHSSPPGEPLCDNFNRANSGTLGGNWNTNAGTASIVSNSARCAGQGRSIFVGVCPGGISQTAEADININGSTGLDYVALAFNYDGTNNLYVKAQQQDSGGTFDHIGFYDDVNGSGWPGQNGGAGFFTIPVAFQFSTAHMRATLYPGGTVRLTFSNINGGSGMLEYQRGGWTFLNGDGAGIGGYSGLMRMDDFGTGGSLVCDRFNRPNSATLGANWLTDTGSAGISGFAARASNVTATPSRSIFVGDCGSCLDTTPPTVDITAPASFSCVCNSVTISGTVGDSNGMYVGDSLQYQANGAATWITAATATGARTGTLYTFNTAALTEGYYYVRVVGTNDCGLSNSDTTIVWVGRTFDSAILRSPVSGQILGGTVCFDGTAEDNNCFRNYSLMYRALPGGVFAPVDPAFPLYLTPVRTDPLGSWNTASGPTAVPDGDYEVRLRGSDNCGDIADVVRTITVDNTSPIGVITSPTNCQFVQGVVQVVGTASDANLAGWVLQYNQGGGSPWVTISSGSTNVVNGVLGNWNTAGLPHCAYVLRLVVGDQANVSCSGNNHQAEFHVKVNDGRVCDLNGDGLCDGADIQYFVNCLLGFACP